MRWWTPTKESLLDLALGFGVSCLSYALWAWRTEACASGLPLLTGGLTSAEGALDTFVLWKVAVNRKWMFAVGCVVGMGVGAGVATAFRR